ncbi:DUF3094 family protein [Pseudomonas syringae]|uniref:DUF3094 family protein n=1 Tax=Pseudomonas syringae TaxID=317 RepID=UPI001CED91A8|nr:DUF3094 family protein [Pseudomonas syringae]MDG6395526.1 DUF3094 family protein [Pseudomonas syringae pv. actinidiae]MDG6413804.1 DUF3094 family protein [Pseudomonas syringae pv. actinidiae]MDG6419183.1 DUF3094 family protein [Pseudomonas syringae pv. actinidiae]MDG6424798.1 DUF3094 family protein [Pseudomonas syringae pv. actinidiae]MDG6434751.1 DUF3094 family protein [Pseudomonas syringae pv. actinidiae]
MAELPRGCYKAASSAWTIRCRSSRWKSPIPGPLPDSTLETTHKVSRRLNPEAQRCVEEYLQAIPHPVERRPLLMPELL